jgi:glycosyltransferase involved in cell wall biosynthesis
MRMRTAIHRRHVSLVTETYPPEINGVALTLARLAEGLRARGHTVSVVRPRQPACDARGRGHDGTLVLVPGIPLPGYGGLRLGLPAGATLRACWTRHRPDVVYVATEGPLGWSAVSTARRLGLPVLSGFHTNFHGYARHYHARWLERAVARYLRRFHNRTGGTLVATADLRRQLGTLGVENVGVLGRGVDGRAFTPERRCAALRRAWGASETDLVALYVGRLAPEKNIGLAIGAYRAMQREGRAARLVVVGAGPLRASLQDAHPDLVFPGALRGERLAAHYASADVFLFPSETETFGNVTLEAMASGLGVIAYDYAATRIHIDNGVSGLAIREGDRQGFIAAAVKLATNPDLLPPMRREARAAMEVVAWARVVERFERLLAGAAREEEDHRDEHGSAAPGTGHRRRGGADYAEARGGALHPARAGADAASAATAVASGPDVSLYG